MKRATISTILLFAVSGVVNASQHLTVNNQATSWITLEAGQSCTVEVVSSGSESYVAFVGFDNGVVLGDFSHQRTEPEAGDSAEVTEYKVPTFYGYRVVAAGISRQPSPGVHFVFRYEAQQFGETDVKLYSSAFGGMGPILSSIHIRVIPQAMGTAFTYQGYLVDSNSPADGSYDFRFRLFNHATGGDQQGNIIYSGGVDVADGYFTVELDFCAAPSDDLPRPPCDIFNGEARWIEIAVRKRDIEPPDVGIYVVLSPRQRVTPGPYAIYARTAGGIPGGVSGAGNENYLAKFTGEDTIGDSVVYELGGKVGVGTINPGEILDVAGNIKYTGNLTKLNVADNFTATVGAADLYFGHSSRRGTPGRALVDMGGSLILNFEGDWPSTEIEGQTTAISGKLGVGTTTPGYQLDVVGGARIAGDIYEGSTRLTDKYLGKGETAANADKVDDLHVSDLDGRYVNQTGDSMSGSLSVTDNTSGAIAVRGEATDTSQTFGNVGGCFYAYSLFGAGVMGVAANNGDAFNYGGEFYAYGKQGIGAYGQCWGDNGKGVEGNGRGYDFYAIGPGVDYGSSSSIRWKRDVRPIDDPIGKVMSLQGVFFNWDAEHGGGHDVGMVAEEVGQVLPEIVQYEDNGVDATGMDYSKLTPLLVEAVKALKQDVDEQRQQQARKDAEIAAQQTQIEKLQEEVAELKHLVAKMVELK